MDDIDPDLLPEGLEDRLAGVAEAASTITRAVTDAMMAHGYDRISPPLVEFERSLAQRMSGVARRKLVRFTDPVSLRTLALRDDMTVQLGRIAASRLAHAPRPLRLCYAGQVVRIRGDQLEPARERTQLGAELIGHDNVAAAGEIVILAIEALEAAGATGISVDFTLPDLVDTLAASAFPLAADQVSAVRRELDAKDAGGLTALGAEAYLPLLYATGPFDGALARLEAIDAGGALASRIAALRDIAARVGTRARLTLDPSERHGFEYQSWFGFSLYADGVRGTLGRGGTYSITHRDGNAEPATGFSLYPDALIEQAAIAPATSQRLFLPLGHDAAVAARLRAIGWRTVAAMDAGDDPVALGCSHTLDGETPTAL